MSCDNCTCERCRDSHRPPSTITFKARELRLLRDSITEVVRAAAWVADDVRVELIALKERVAGFYGDYDS